MSKDTNKSVGGKDVLRLVTKDRESNELGELRKSTVEAQLEYYSQKDSPLGRRTHLRLVRERVIPGHKVGKLVFVRRCDMHAYIERKWSLAEATVSDSSDEPLSDWGLKRGRRK